MRRRLISAFIMAGILFGVGGTMPARGATYPTATNIYGQGITPVYVPASLTNPATGETRTFMVDQALLPAGDPVPVDGSAATSSSGNSGCWSKSAAFIQYDAIGAELWRLSLSRRWCGTYGSPYLLQITEADAGTAQPNIKGVGGAWSWRGIVTTNTDISGDYYYSYGGYGPKAGNAEWVTGEFQLCFTIPLFGQWCGYTRYPHVWINAHFDGGSVPGADNAGTEK